MDGELERLRTLGLAIGGHITTSDLLVGGVSREAIRSAERAGRWTRPHRGVYALSKELDDRSRIVAAHVHLGDESVAVLSSAAELHGVAGIVGDRLPEFALPPELGRDQRPGLRIYFWELPPEQVCHVDGVPVTTLRRTLADLARLLPRMQAVSCLDSAIHRGHIDVAEVRALGRFMSRKRRCVPGRRVLLEARPGAQSPLETRVRLCATAGGYPPDALQVPINDASGRVIGYGDLGYRLRSGEWVVVEADGRSVHDQPDALLYDRRRQNAFQAAGARHVLRFTWEDTLSPATIPSALRAVLDVNGWRPGRL